MLLKDLILNIRKKLWLTQTELAEKIGMQQASLSRYEKGERLPQLGTLKKIVNFANENNITAKKIRLTDFEEY